MHVPICMRITNMDACKHAALKGLLRLAEDGVPHGRRFIHLRSYWSLRAYTSASTPTRLLLHHFLPSFLLSAHRHAPQARLQTHLQTGRRPFKSVHARTQPVPLMLTTATGARLFSTTIPRRADVTLTIDGKEVSVPAGTALIQACEKAYVILSF